MNLSLIHASVGFTLVLQPECYLTTSRGTSRQRVGDLAQTIFLTGQMIPSVQCPDGQSLLSPLDRTFDSISQSFQAYSFPLHFSTSVNGTPSPQFLRSPNLGIIRMSCHGRQSPTWSDHFLLFRFPTLSLAVLFSLTQLQTHWSSFCFSDKSQSVLASGPLHNLFLLPGALFLQVLCMAVLLILRS